MNELFCWKSVFQILGSPIREDECGICGGDGSKCETKEKSLQLTTSDVLQKVFIVPAGSRNIKLDITSGMEVHFHLLLQ